MRIRTLILSAVSASILMVAAMAVAGWIITTRLAAVSLAQQKAQLAALEITDLLVLTHEYALYSGERAAQQWRSHQVMIEALLDGARNDIVPPAPETLADAKLLSGIFQRLVEASTASTDRSDLQGRRKNLLVDQLQTSSQTLADSIHHWSMATAEYRQKAEYLFSMVAIAMPVLMLLILTLLAGLLYRRVLNPLQRLHAAVTAVAKGDLTVHSATAANDELGELSRTFDAMAVELVTELRAEIAERSLTAAALEESEELFRAVAQSANDAIVSSDSTGKIIRWSKGAESTFGYAEQEVIGQPLTLLMPQRFRQPHVAGMARVSAGGAPHVMGKPLELHGLHKDGSEFPLELALAQSQTSAGRFFTAAIRNITERKKIAQALEEQRAHLEKLVEQRTRALTGALEAAKLADRTKDAFLANMSHELRTPLNAVIGMAGLARELGTDAKQRDYLDKIAGSGKHLNRIINDLLDLSKIAAGHLEFETIPFSLRASLQRCNSVMAHRAEEKGLTLAATIDAAVPDILFGDPHRLEQILFNLIANAIKFTAAGQVGIHVSLHARKDNRACLDVDVSDTGIGMREEDIQRLFQPFVQADATITRRFGGTGLGLIISRQLAEMMDGDISVTSREGHGTTFKVRIWLGVGDGSDLRAIEAAGGETLPQRYRNVNVLVADDQPLNCEIVEALLAAVGITPRVAGNGREVLDILREAGPGAFDLVLMDIQMPVMDGLTATRELRSLTGFEDLPIIAMTAHTMTHEKKIGVDAGMNDHIGKPFDNAGFYRTLAKWIPGDKHDAAPADPPAATPADPGPALETLRGVDVIDGLARFSGKESRYRYWLADFAATAGAIPDQLRGDVAAGQPDAAARKAHALKGRVGMLGMRDLHDLVSRLEQALREGAEAEELMSGVQRAIQEMSDEVKRVLGGAADVKPSVRPQLEKVTWSETYRVGVAEMDAQHKRLFAMINRLADCYAAQNAGSSAVFMEVLSGMFDYTQVHFRAEENYLQRIGFPGLAAHENEHAVFVEAMTRFNMAAAGGVLDMAGVHRYLWEWLSAHILKADMQYRRFVEERR